MNPAQSDPRRRTKPRHARTSTTAPDTADGAGRADGGSPTPRRTGARRGDSAATGTGREVGGSAAGRGDRGRRAAGRAGGERVAPADPEAGAPPLPEDRFLNRELSWLDFNARVLALAEDPRTPLLERAKFLAIFASNLDEFYMVRIVGLKRRVKAGLPGRGLDRLPPREQAVVVARRSAELMARHARVFRDDVATLLADEGIRIVSWHELSEAERERQHAWFRDHIFMLVSRKTPSRRMAAGLSILIMTLIGLWHGFTWLYLLWGIYHGILLALENLFNQTTVNKRKISRAHFYARCLLVQLFVTAAVIVYSESAETVLRIYRGLLSPPSF